MQRSVESNTGIPIEARERIFTPTRQEANGQYTPSSAAGERVRFIPRGGIDLSLNSEMSQPQTLGHEITHTMKENAPEAYSALEEYVIEAAKETNADAFESRINSLINKYG